MYQCRAVCIPHNVNFDPREGKYLFDMYGKVNAWQDYLISRKYTHITRPSTGLPPPFIQHTTQTTNADPNQQDDAISTLSGLKENNASIIAETINQDSIADNSMKDTNSQVSQVERTNKKSRSNDNNTSNDNSDNNNDSRMTSNLDPDHLPNPVIVITAPSFTTIHDTNTMISQITMMPENYRVDLSLCSFPLVPPAEHGIMIKGNMSVLAILDNTLNQHNILGHEFYHTYIHDQTTTNVAASIVPINEKEETLARHPMIKTLKRLCPPNPQLINRLKQILNSLDEPQAITMQFMQDLSNYNFECHSPDDSEDQMPSL